MLGTTPRSGRRMDCVWRSPLKGGGEENKGRCGRARSFGSSQKTGESKQARWGLCIEYRLLGYKDSLSRKPKARRDADWDAADDGRRGRSCSFGFDFGFDFDYDVLGARNWAGMANGARWFQPWPCGTDSSLEPVPLPVADRVRWTRTRGCVGVDVFASRNATISVEGGDFAPARPS